METAQFAILAGLSVVSIGLCVYLLSKIRTITYLLEQPVVKKMSPQLKLKPVKVDELDENRANAPARNANGAPQNRGPRPGFEGERQNRDNRDANRDRAPRGDRPEGEGRREGGERGERFDRGPRNDRGDRGERGERFGGSTAPPWKRCWTNRSRRIPGSPNLTANRPIRRGCPPSP